MLLTLEVGARVKLAPGHDHKLLPGYSLVTENITQAQRDKLNTKGPKYGAVVRLCPEKCAYEVNRRFKQGIIKRFLSLKIRMCGVLILVGAWWLDAAAKGNGTISLEN